MPSRITSLLSFLFLLHLTYFAFGEELFAGQPLPRVALVAGGGGRPAGTFRYSLVTGRFFEWNTDPTAVPGLFREVAARTGVKPELTAEAIALGSPRLHENPMLILTGNRVFHLSEAEVVNLRTYLEKGGFLYADDCGGSDLSFRREIKRIFPDKELKELSPEHPLFSARYELQAVPKIIDLYRGPAKAFGLEVNGRLAVVYTYDTDIPCAWEIYPDGSYIHVVPSAKRENAQRFGVNVVLHALMHHLKNGTVMIPQEASPLQSIPEEAIRIFRMKKQLPCLHIKAFASDDNAVWMGGYAILPGEDEGLARYHLRGRHWRQYLDAEGVLAEDVNCLAVHDKRILIGADTWKFSKGLSVLNPTTHNWSQYTRADGLPHDRVVGIGIRDDAIWAACRRGLSHLAPKATRFRSISVPGGPMKDFLIGVLCTNRYVWVNNFEDLLAYEPQKRRWTSAKERSPLLTGHAAALAANEGRLWIAPAEPTEAPVVLCDESNLEFRPFSACQNLLSPVSAIAVVPAEMRGRRRPEELWIGCADGSLIRCIADWNREYSSERLSRHTHDAGPIRAIHAAGNDLFVASGSFGGVWHFRRDTETWQHVGTREGIPSDTCFSVAVSGPTLFVGTVADGPWAMPVKADGFGTPASLSISMKKDGKPFIYRHGHETIRYTSVYDIAADSNRIWMATNHGLLMHDPESTPQGFAICEGPPWPIKRLAVAGKQVFCGLPDGGVWVFDTQTMQPFPQSWENGEPVHAMANDGERVWVGTNAGLYSVQLEGGRIATDKNAPLPVTALCYGSDKLWVASTKGIHAIETTSETLLHGPLLAEIAGITRMLVLANRLYAAGGTTLHVFDADNGSSSLSPLRSFDLAPHIGSHPITGVCAQSDQLILTTLGGGLAVIETAVLLAP